MLFSSFAYIVFLPVVFVLYWFVFNRLVRWQNVFVLAASCFFYSWLSYWFVVLLLASTVINYVSGHIIGSAKGSKRAVFLWVSVMMNIGILCVFKYSDFFVSGNELFSSIVLPVGLSFYTLRAMSYIFDVYRGRQQAVSNFIDYAVFQSFFPLLLAGPVERAERLLPQIETARTFSYTQAAEGGRRIIWGMFKKLVIANNLALLSGRIFNSYDGHSAYSLIIATVAFSFQLYADVSGYTDIAIGTGKLLGFELSENFRYPYFSRNLVVFWKRWHITLTIWFKDYVYQPIAGVNGGSFRTAAGIVIGFAAMGLWHYAGWNYIVWAGIHAVGVLIVLLLKGYKKTTGKIVTSNSILLRFFNTLQILTTFAFITMAWVFFRTEDVKEGYSIIKRVVTNSIDKPGQYFGMPAGSIMLLYIAPLVVIDWWLQKDESKLRIPNNKVLRFLIYYILVVMSYFMLEEHGYGFMYFRF